MESSRSGGLGDLCLLGGFQRSACLEPLLVVLTDREGNQVACGLSFLHAWLTANLDSRSVKDLASLLVLPLLDNFCLLAKKFLLDI